MSVNPDLLRLLLQQQAMGGGKGGGQAAGGGLGGTPPIVAPQPPGQPAAPMPKLGLLDRFRNYVGNNLVPKDLPGTEGLSADQQQALRTQALRQYGAGLIGGAGSGRGLGRSIYSAAMGAQEGLGQSVDRYQRQSDRTYERARDTKMDERYNSAQTYQQGRDTRLDARQESLDKATSEYRAASLALDQANTASSRMIAREQLRLAQAKATREREQMDQLHDLLQKPNPTQDDLRKIQILSGSGLPSAAFQTDPFGGAGMGNVPTWNPETGKFE